MKILKTITIGLLLAVTALAGSAVRAATTGELLQQGLYAEEVEGNMDSAIKIYAQVIKTRSAPPNHVAQALYRQGMCYLKLKDEGAARAALERLVTEYAGQTEIVEKARPMLNDLTDLDPAALMPPGTLLYAEFGSPGRQVETALTALKGTPFENPLAAMSGQVGGNPNNNQKTAGDLIGALLNPSMMAEFKKIRSSAIGITGFAGDGSSFQPLTIGVFYPGKSDALRGVILAGLGMAGTAGQPIEGMQTVKINSLQPSGISVAYDDKVIIVTQPSSQLEWCVKQYKGLSKEPTLASSNGSFSRVGKTQRQKNALTVWANPAAYYGELLKMFSDGNVPPRILSANAFVDFANLDELILTQSIETNGINTKINVHLKEGNHCLAYDLIRTPNIDRAALEAVPAEAVALASFAMAPADSAQADQVRAKIQNVTGLDLGRELFANMQQMVIFAMPGAIQDIKDRIGLAITSHDPELTRRVLATSIGALSGNQLESAAGRYKISKAGEPDQFCYVEQVNGTTLLSLNRGVVDASVASFKEHKSVLTGGSLKTATETISPHTSKVLLVNAAGALRLFGPELNPGGLQDEQTAQFKAALDQLARATESTSLEVRLDEQPDELAVDAAVTGLPPLSQVLGPITQISKIVQQARAETAARNQRLSLPAMVMPAVRPPVIDGKEDEVWQRIPRNKLENVLSSFGGGEKAVPISSPDDLSAEFRAMWDENNLYLLVDVTDDKLTTYSNRNQEMVLPSGSRSVPWWNDDCIEVFIDADNAKGTQYGPNDGHYHFNWDATKPTMGADNGHGRLDGVEFAMVRTAKGYRTEIKFPWTALALKPSAGALIGLDVHVNDDDNGGGRQKKITWHDRSDQAYQNPQTFGNGLLAGMVGWWKFDETQGTVAADSSGGHHNGTLVGNAKWARGKTGGAIDLDGHGSYVRVADKSAFDMGREVTLAGWINLRSVPAEWTMIVGKGDSSWRLSTVRQERKIHFAVNQFEQFGDEIMINGNDEVGSGWHHVAAAYNGETMSLFVDGKLDSTQPSSHGIGRNDFEVLIGENSENQGRSFDGLIDDLRIYNYALTENQIQALAAGH